MIFLFHMLPDVIAQDVKTGKGTDTINLQITKGFFTGHIDNKPLVKVLETISQKIAFEYQGDENLLNRPVSGYFNEVSFPDTLQVLLKSFNYSLITSRDLREPAKLYIKSLKDNPDNIVKPLLLKSSESSVSNISKKSEKLNEEKQRILSEAKRKYMKPPPELLDQFVPLQQQGTEKTGPPGPIDTDDIEKFDVDFQVVFSDTGPPIPKGNSVREDFILDFQPIVSETGPPIIEDTQ